MNKVFLPCILVATMSALFAAETPAPAPAPAPASTPATGTAPIEATTGVPDKPSSQAGTDVQPTDGKSTSGVSEADLQKNGRSKADQNRKQISSSLDKRPGDQTTNDGLATPNAPLTGQQTPGMTGEEKNHRSTLVTRSSRVRSLARGE